MAKKYHFYDPNQGGLFRGAAMPLPQPMVKAAAQLDGKMITLEDAISELQPIAEELGGEVEVADDGNHIRFGIGRESQEKGIGPWHMYRLIRYK